jgi:hypothetical protein
MIEKGDRLVHVRLILWCIKVYFRISVFLFPQRQFSVREFLSKIGRPIESSRFIHNNLYHVNYVIFSGNGNFIDHFLCILMTEWQKSLAMSQWQLKADVPSWSEAQKLFETLNELSNILVTSLYKVITLDCYNTQHIGIKKSWEINSSQL